MSVEFREFATRLNDEAMRWGLKAKAQRGMDGLISIGVAEALMQAAHMARDTAIAMEARQGGDGVTRLHPKDDSAGPQDIAQDVSPPKHPPESPL